ncbi:hypothetical protein ABIB68_002804 [Bradyrhizobium sp. F1.2.2]
MSAMGSPAACLGKPFGAPTQGYEPPSPPPQRWERTRAVAQGRLRTAGAVLGRPDDQGMYRPEFRGVRCARLTEKVRTQVLSLRHQPRPANLYLASLSPVRNTLPSAIAADMAMLCSCRQMLQLSLSKWRRQNPGAMRQSGGSLFHHSTSTCVVGKEPKVHERCRVLRPPQCVATARHAETRLYTVA